MNTTLSDSLVYKLFLWRGFSTCTAALLEKWPKDAASN
jgi:hypothetical protein